MRDKENQMVLKNSRYTGDGKPTEVKGAVSLSHELHVNTAHTALESPSTGVRPIWYEFQNSAEWPLQH